MNPNYRDGPSSIESLLGSCPPNFAVLYRPEVSGPDRVDILTGKFSEHESLASVELSEPNDKGGKDRHEQFILIPYKQIGERGLEAKDDGSELLVMDVDHQSCMSKADVLAAIPGIDMPLSNAKFDMGDDDYAKTVSEILRKEIGEGKGASFVIQRSFTGNFQDYSVAGALAIFKNLVAKSSGSYWTFIAYTGDRVLVGATPERHITLNQGVAVMNPISGTYRYPASGAKLSEVLSFLGDRKEAEELYMVLDEELKMMGRICESGGVVEGPCLKEMAHVAHTEYYIKGTSSVGPLEILRETMFAPSVTGSPIESAARVIRAYEPAGRGYYSGVAALIGTDNGQRTLDSSILIRTADINREGRLRLQVGATLVRGSTPLAEAEETRAKAAGVLSAIGIHLGGSFGNRPEVVELLNERNNSIAPFWLSERASRASENAKFSGKKVLVIDAEDTFSAMIKHQLTSLGCKVEVRKFDESLPINREHDLVLMGPGPGDPSDLADPKVARLHSTIRRFLKTGQPFAAVCLSHQVLSLILGLDVVRRKDPNQGVQKPISLFERTETVGFYNTFAARLSKNQFLLPGGRLTAEVARDASSDEVHAIRGPGFYSVQFHPESILTLDGVRIFESILAHVLESQPSDRAALNSVA
ncbi:anthranilate synthase family protein [Marinimicrobium locisalis]|uniref:anthranilate synthase family protein n=1 Tax=Marinimicrobium locisalis TaxID=546022 RepID=UPI003221E71C